MKFKIVLGWALLLTVTVNAQNPDAKKYGSQVTANQLKEYLTIIASDALEGRETGTRGQKMAAAFIAAHFQELGFKAPVNGSYYQPVELFSSSQGEVYLKVGQTKLDNFSGVVYTGTGDSGGEISLPVVFAGYGTETDFKQVDVKDKAVVLLAKDTRTRSNPAVKMAREKGAKLVLVNGHETLAEFDNWAAQVKAYLSGGDMGLTKPEAGNTQAPVMLLSPVTLEKMFNTKPENLKTASAADPKKNALKKFKAANIQYKTSSVLTTVSTENVLGYLEGTDKKDELVVITAHYDHIGKRKGGEGDLINNGADDDGSGTVSVLAIAKAFALAKKEGKGPRRSILFMTVTGEEKGLLGSEYYSEHPVFPLASTVVDLNIDMVGRRDPQHKEGAYVYVIGSDKLSNDLHALSERVNKENLNIAFDYTYNDQNHPERLYYRSDHWNFAKKNIPIIFYFDGIHEDYHRPSDEVSKIEFDLIEKRAQTVFFTAWEIANRDQRLPVDEDKRIKD
jgi:Peptidase family M28